MTQHRLAFVGIGRVADVHYGSIQAMPERAQLVAVCDTRVEAREKRSAEWGVPAFDSFERMLREVDPDAVCLFLPHHVHLKYVSLAAHAGKPVFLETHVRVSAGWNNSARSLDRLGVEAPLRP